MEQQIMCCEVCDPYLRVVPLVSERAMRYLVAALEDALDSTC